jgi:trehalose 6-phosphate synthase/phosphatase
MLLPAMLRAAAPNLKIGFFLHTPFPANEIFRCHPRRRELVAGLLGADRIGFHAFGYLRHFCSTVQRLLDIETELTHISSGGRSTALGVYPIGINAPKFAAG